MKKHEISKRDVRNALYRSFELRSPDGENEETERSLGEAINAVFVRKTHGTPDLDEVLRRIRKQETEERTIPIPRKRLRRRLPLIAAAAACLFLLPVLLFRNSEPGITILTAKGNPRIIAGRNNRKPEPGTVLSGRIKVETGKNEHITLGIGRSRILISGSTRLAVLPLRTDKDKPSCTTALTNGLARFDIEKKAFSSFTVDFPEGKIVVTGTRFAVSTTAVTTRVGVLHGSVSVFMKNKNTPIRLQTDNGVEIRNGKSRIIQDAAAQSSFSEIFINTRKKPAPRKTIRRQTGKKRTKPVKFSERLYMKDGSVITGKILSQNKTIVRVKTSYGVITVPWPKVKRVAYIK